jgi:hypothetical protein
MHYMTRRSHQMQKHKFGLMCPRALFMETTPGPAKHEKWCIDVSRRGRNEIHYVTHRSHQMQRHTFGVTCPGAFFVESVLVPIEHEK